MECDLQRLRLACTASVKRLDEDRRFQMSIHGVKAKPAYEPPKNLVEQDQRVAATFAMLGTVKVERPAG